MARSVLNKEAKKEISRLRSEVRKLTTNMKKELLQPQTGAIYGNYWSQTGMPWAESDGRKAVLTEWFWQPIRGQPRRVDTNELRSFAQTFWVNSCVNTIIDEVTTIDWEVIAKDDADHLQYEDEIERVREFLAHPNKDGESFQDVLRALIKDVLELDAGVLVKVFDVGSYDFDQLEPRSGAPLLKDRGQRRMTELYARDGASFLADTDKFGYVYGFWQYSYQIPAHPMWFSKPEICYVKKYNRSMSPYGYSPVQSILDIVKSLHYSTQYNKRFFEETPMPSGVISAINSNEQDIRNLAAQWNTDFKAQPHKLLFANNEIKWQPFTISNRELEFLETQNWYYKMVVSAFGLTPTELGMTDDANRATAATQAEVTRRRAVRPILMLLENAINTDIIPELTQAPLEFSFVVDDPVEKSQRLANWKMELDMGIKTVNDIRAEMGLNPVSWGDTPATHQQQVGFGQESNQMGVGEGSDPDAEQPSPEANNEGEEQHDTADGDEGKDKTETDAEQETQEKTRNEENEQERKRRTQNKFDSSRRPVGSFR